MKKQNYYFYSEKSFTEEQFENDKQAIDSLAKKTDCVRILRAKDSTDIWKKESAKPETK